MIRAVVDTSVWVAALRTQNRASASSILLRACRQRQIEIVTCAELLAEAAGVLSREELRLTARDIAEFIEFLGAVGLPIPLPGIAFGCPDPEDEMLFEAAIVGRASFLVTLDKALFSESVARFAAQNNFRIVTPGELVNELRSVGIVIDNEVVRDVSFLKQDDLGQFIADYAEKKKSLALRLAEVERDAPRGDPDEADISIYFQERDEVRQRNRELDETFEAALFKNAADLRRKMLQSEKAAAAFSAIMLQNELRAAALGRSPGWLIGAFLPDAPGPAYERLVMAVRGADALEREIKKR